MGSAERTRPFVTVHYAQTLDGRIATRTGSSRWISGPESLTLAHELRAAHQGILVGVGTVLADNPQLTVRLVPGDSPTRVVVDSHLRLPLDATLLRDDAAPTLVAATPLASADRVAAVRALGVEVLPVQADPAGRVDLTDLLTRLHARGMESLMVEGGAGIITSLLAGRLVDRLVVCIAPKVLGHGIAAVGDLGLDRLSDAIAFAEASFTPCGADIIFDGRVQHAAD
jgi:5-amino-6-(5-phosphoribosylamino)uracil reductase/diaminohydroxyphosphoribosylaminopyrimidine deaminase/5-amino-6-(5-phosphoribosylamino)uracil reductase